MKKCVSRIVEGNASHWLTVIPTTADNYDLSPTQFRDALYLRYAKEITLPQVCDGCGSNMNVSHALNCKKGGLVKYGHDSLKNNNAALAKLAWNSVSLEPIIRDAHGEEVNALIGDVKVVGLWEAGKSAFLDYRIINADAASYSQRHWSSIANSAAREKHQKYDKPVEDIRGSFTPMICSVDGVIHIEFKQVLRRLAYTLSEKWNRPYSKVFEMVTIQTQFSIIRAVDMRLRGSRRKIYSLNEDGAGLGY